jgi:ferredoxin
MLKINKDKCIGCGACVAVSPKIFTFNEDEGKAEIIADAKMDDKQIKEAMSVCPTEAIEI